MLRMGNLALELSRLETNTFIKRTSKDMLGFIAEAQNGKPSSGALKAGNEHFHFIKRSSKEMIGVRGETQNGESIAPFRKLMSNENANIFGNRVNVFVAILPLVPPFPP